MWIQIINFLGLSALIIAGTGWVLRKVVDHFFNTKIESYKSELEKETTKFRIIYETLHSERATVIKEVYKRLVQSYDTLLSYVNLMQMAGDDSQEVKRVKAAEAYNEFRTYYDIHRIFFEESSASQLDVYREALFGVWHQYELSKILREEGDGGGLKEWNAAFKTVKDDVPPIRKEIENEFRRIIGIT